MLARREVRDIVFTIIIVAVIGGAVWEARTWELKARLFPWAIGIPVLALLVALLVRQLTILMNKSPLHSAEAPSPGESDPVQAAVARRRTYSIVGWLLGFLAAIWLLGFPVGATLGTLAFLKLSAGEKWPMTLAISAGTAAFFVIMIQGLNTPFPRGPLFELFGG